MGIRCLVALAAIGCILAPMAGAAPSKVVVTPEKTLVVRAGQATITGPSGALTEGGRLEVSSLRLGRNQRDPRAFGIEGTYAVGGRGVVLSLKRLRFRKAITVTLPVPRSHRGRAVVAFRRVDGRWGQVPARRVGPRLIRATITPRQFGMPAAQTHALLLPSSFVSPLVSAIGDAAAWARDSVGRSAVRWATSTTTPLDCAPAPSWMALTATKNGFHTCVKNNPAAGRDRAEVQIKSNRGYYIAVDIPVGAEYVWVSDQDDATRKILASVLRYDASKRVMLAPGQWMTIGFPRSDLSYLFAARTNWQSTALTLSGTLLDYVGERSPQAQAKIAADVISNCINPASTVTATSVVSSFRCALRRLPVLVADPAILPLEGEHALSPKRDSLRRAASKLTGVVSLVPSLSSAAVGIADGTRYGELRLTVTAPPAPSGTGPAPPNSSPPAQSGSVPAPPVTSGPTPPAERQVALTVYNKVTNGPTEMREDTPAYLSTLPRNFCRRDGCMIGGTERGTGGVYSPAVCQATGITTTNGNNNNANDDFNPGLFSSNRWYGVRVAGGIGYISEVWISPDQRGGQGLRSC